MEWVVRVKRYLYLNDNQTELAKFSPGAQFADGASKCLKISQITEKGPPNPQTLENTPAGPQASVGGRANDKAWESKGFTLVLCGRPKGGQSGAPARLFHVPLEESRFKSVVEELKLHKHLVRVLERGSTYMSAAELHPQSGSSSSPPPSGSTAGPATSKIPSTKSGSTSNVTTTASNVEVVYTAFHQSGKENYVGSLAFTSTFFELKTSSCGIILGCTDDDMIRVIAMLAGCETAWDHPLLLPSVFAELQRRRLRNLSESLNNRAIQVLEDLKDDIKELSKMSDDHAVGNSLRWASDLGKVQNDSNLIGEDLVAASRQLEKWTSHAKELLVKDEGNKKERVHDTRRFAERFQEIGLDLQDLIASCRVNVSEAALTAEGFQNDLARRQAKANASQTQASTIIAFAAMLYLPISTMASIFAMPVFDFKAAWRNLWNEPSAASSSSDETQVIPSTTESVAATATTRPATDPLAASPVVSVYLWYYLASTIALMLLTFEIWYWHSHSNLKRRKRTATSGFVIRTGKSLAKNVKTLWSLIVGSCLKKTKTKQSVLPTTQPPATIPSKSSGTPNSGAQAGNSGQSNVATTGSGSGSSGAAPSVVQLGTSGQPQVKKNTPGPTPTSVPPSARGVIVTVPAFQTAPTPASGGKNGNAT